MEPALPPETDADEQFDDTISYKPTGPALTPRESARIANELQGASRGDEVPRIGTSPNNTLEAAPSLQVSETIQMPKGQDALCSRFSPDGSLLAVSNSRGAAEVYRVSDASLAFTLDASIDRERRPCTTLRFRPASANNLTKNVVITADAHGDIRHWHATTGKSLGIIVEKGNQIYTLGYRPDGQRFASGGLDTKVRLYDESTRKLLQVLEEGDGKKTVGHTNRIFAVKFHPTDENALLSGGWDNTIQVWDLRVNRSVRSIFGPHICGDSLDICGDRVLTGSWRPSEQLEVWDFWRGVLLHNIHWPAASPKDEPSHLYAAQYGRGSAEGLIAAGGSGVNEARLIDQVSGNIVGRLAGLPKAVYSVAFSQDGDNLAVTSADGVRIVATKR